MTVSAVKHHKVSHPTSSHTTKVPTKSQLNNILGSWGFQSRNNPNGVWHSTTKPAGLKPNNVLKEIVLEQPRKGIMGGATIRAYLLKSPANTVVFEKSQALAPPNGLKYFGPVPSNASPK